MSGTRRSWLLAYGLVIALLVSISAQLPEARASESQQPGLQIGFADGSDQWTPTLSSPDIVGKSYEITPPGGSERTVDVASGYSLESFLTSWEHHTGVSSSRFSLVEVPADTGTTLLTEAEAMSDPKTTTHAPVFWTDKQDSVDFADENPDDYVSEIDQVALFTGEELTVSITTAKQTIPENSIATFTAHVSPATGKLQYDWFIVGTNGDLVQGGKTYRAPFPLRGSFRVYLVVEGDPTGSSIGVSNQLPISVGPPKQSAARRHDDGTNRHRRSSGSESDAKGSTTGTSAAGKSGSTTATRKSTTTVTKRRRKSPPRRLSGPLLSGIAITSPGVAGAESSANTSALGVHSAAEAGHVARRHVTTHHGLHLGEGFWIVLGVLTTLSTGMLLESRGLRRRLLQPLTGTH